MLVFVICREINQTMEKMIDSGTLLRISHDVYLLYHNHKKFYII